MMGPCIPPRQPTGDRRIPIDEPNVLLETLFSSVTVIKPHGAASMTGDRERQGATGSDRERQGATACPFSVDLISEAGCLGAAKERTTRNACTTYSLVPHLVLTNHVTRHFYTEFEVFTHDPLHNLYRLITQSPADSIWTRSLIRCAF